MSTRKSCPRKGSTFIVAGNPVIATGTCPQGKVQVATVNSGVVALNRGDLQVTRGRKREEARNALRMSGNPIAEWLAGDAKPMRKTAARKATAAATMPQLLPTSSGGGTMVPRWNPATQSMQWVMVPMPSSAAQASANLPEAWQYLHAGEAGPASMMTPGSYHFFDGLSGIGAMHPYGMDTAGVLKWHGELFEKDMAAKRCDAKAVTTLHQVRSEIDSARREGIIDGLEAGRMENQVVRLFNKSCVVKPRR